MPHLITELNRLRDALGTETVAMMLQHEAAGTLYRPEYQAAITILNYRHVCRLQDRPAPLQRLLKGWNMDVYGTMQGPNEFLYSGNFKDWNRIPDMHRITQPLPHHHRHARRADAGLRQAHAAGAARRKAGCIQKQLPSRALGVARELFQDSARFPCRPS